jgi:hypothetical protein
MQCHGVRSGQPNELYQLRGRFQTAVPIGVASEIKQKLRNNGSLLRTGQPGSASIRDIGNGGKRLNPHIKLPYHKVLTSKICGWGVLVEHSRAAMFLVWGVVCHMDSNI